jgi:hypothetical protein
MQSFAPYPSADMIGLAADILGIIVFTWLAEKFPE